MIKGIKENEMAINYVHTRVQTVVSNLQNTMANNMNGLLVKQIEHSNQFNYELEELKLGLIDLVNGKLSPLLISPSTLLATLKDIQKILDKAYPGFHPIYTDVQDVYLASNFLYTRNHSDLFITIKVPISYQQKPLSVYSIKSVPLLFLVTKNTTQPYHKMSFWNVTGKQNCISQLISLSHLPQLSHVNLLCSWTTK